uniref:Uncharacterized protein n=1 Tax=Neovison vison TaxID=452646 RepID=A0A8C7AWW2_NEOVI
CPSAQLPEGSSMIPKMENFFTLRSTGTTWLSSSPTSWVIDTIFAFLCGLGLFLLLLPCFQSNPSLPPARKYRSTRKLVLPVSCSCLGRLPDKGGFHQLLCQDLPGELYKAAPAGAHQPCGENVDAAAPAMSLLATPVPLTQHPLLLGPKTSSVSVHSHSSLSVSWPPETFLPLLPQPLALSPPSPCPLNSEACPPPLTTSSAPQTSDSILTLPQCDSKTLPLGTVAQRSSHTPWSASPIPTTSGLGHSSCPISALSWWHTAAKALCLSTSSNYEYQHEHLSHHSPEASFWENPTEKLRVAAPSLLNSDDQKFLEIQVTEGIKINIWKEKEKDGSYPKQMSPDYHLNSLGNMLKSLDVEQKSPQHFWSTKGKPEQLPGPQQLSYPKVLGHHLQQKYNQLFWGLPSLHSESLVATAWISESSSALQSPSFLFNGISSACPVQMQPKLSPMLSQSKPLSQLEFQSQNLISTIPQFQHAPLTQILTQDHLQSSLPILSSSSSPHIRACQISCPIAQDKSQFLIPTEIQHPEWPLLQEQLESGALSSVIKGSQEVFSVFTSNLPEDSWVVSILPENFPISPELRKQLEQHLQKWLVQHRWELPRKIQESLELRQYQGELPGTCQAKGKHGPSRPSAFAGKSSKDTQKVGFQLSQGMGKGLGYILGKVPKDISRASENSLIRFQGVGSEESESDLGLSQSDSGSDLLRNLDKNLENLLTHNLSRKLGQISERMPMSVRQTGMAVNHAFPKSNTDMEIRNLGILKGWRPYVNTSHRVSFLHPDIQGVLEAHIIRFWVRHRWSLPLKVLKPINLFKLKKVQPLPILQFASAPEATCVSGAPSMVKFAEFLGKPSQSCLGKKAIIEESVSTLERPFLAPSPMYGEIQRVLGRAPSGDNKGSLKTFLIGQEDRPPSQSLTLNFMGKTQQSTIKKLSRMSVFQDPGETCLNEEISEFKSKMNTKSENQLQDYSTNMLLDADNLASQVPQCHPQRVSTGDPVPSQMLYGFITDQRSCLRQQEPMIPKLQDSWKSQSKMTVPTNKREDYRRLNSGNEEQFEELRTSQGECMCHPAPVRGITDSVRSRYIQVPPEKKQGPPESLFRKRVRRFFQWIFPSEKVKGQNALQKCNPIIAPAQSQGPVKSRSIMASETPEAQALMTTVGQILEEKMVIHHGLHATKLNEHKQELQAPVCGYVCYHRLPFYPEQRRIMSYTAHGHQATSKDPSSSIRERQARHQQSLKSVRFKDEQLGLKHFPSPPPKKTLSPVSPCQYGPRMPGVPGHHQHCPRHCLLQGGILSSQP